MKLLEVPAIKLALLCLSEPRTTSELIDCARKIGYRSGKHVMMDLYLMNRLGLVRYDYTTFRWTLTERGRRELEKALRSDNRHEHKPF